MLESINLDRLCTAYVYSLQIMNIPLLDKLEL